MESKILFDVTGLIDKYTADWKTIAEKIRLADTEKKLKSKHYFKGRKDALSEIINDLIEIKFN